MSSPRRSRHLRRTIVPAMACASLLVSVAHLWLAGATTGRITDDAADVRAAPVALVFGAGLEPDGRPSLALADRVDAAVALYRAGTVDHLLMSGDNSRADYDEPTSMRRRAVDAGVPASAITLDHAGFDTHDTCVRAARVFGVRRAVLVTQDFHIGRAIASCRAAGIDATGLSITTRGFSPVDEQALRLRERVAVVKAFTDASARTHPTHLGEPVGLPGSATLPPVNQAWDDALVARRGGR